MEITVKVNDNSFVKIKVGNDEYKFVDGTERNAVVSSKGEIFKRYAKNCKTKERKDYYETVIPSPAAGGYVQVSIPKRKDLKQVHRIVAETFIDNPRGCREVDHINRDKLDNRVENLRWVTHEENMVNVPKCTERTYYRDITARDLVTGKEYFFKKTSDIVPLAQERQWGKGWGYRLKSLLKQNGGTAYGFFWTAKTRETKNIR